MDNPRRRNLLLLPAALLVVAGLTACGDTDDGGADAPTTTAGTDGATVTVKTFAFGPDPLEVPAGTAITFLNEDAIDHTVTAGTRDAPEPGRFDGQLPGKGATFELTLDEPGTYEYFCQIHPGPGMTATIEVV
jgi:plastocyanin